jgi:hypothetical protein
MMGAVFFRCHEDSPSTRDGGSSESLARILPDIGLMVVLIIVFFAGAYVSFLKYDVR